MGSPVSLKNSPATLLIKRYLCHIPAATLEKVLIFNGRPWIMRKLIAIAGTTALVFGGLIDFVDARTRSFEIGGRQFSYETTNPQQITAARKLIEAANAADAAKAKADRELAANPLAKLLGTQAQKEAAEAQAHLVKTIAAYEQETSVQPKPASQKAFEEPRRAATTKRTGPGAAGTAREQGAAPGGREVHADATEASDTVRATHVNPPPSPAALRPAVKNVFVDAASGIKTIFLTDGSIHEEPIDPSKPSLSPDRNDAGASTGSINQAR
jgi:hypothetical protein